MTKHPSTATLMAVLAATSLLGLSARADTPGDEPVARSIPLGPPQTSVPTSLAESYSAFPADILAQMRAAIIARAERAVTDPPLDQGQDD